MAKTFGDEAGLFWNQPVKVGRTSTSGSGVTVVRERQPLKRPPAPADYRPPTEFPSFKHLPRVEYDLETFDPNLPNKGPGTKRKDGYVVGFGVNGEYYPIAHEGGPNCDKEKVVRWLQDEFKDYKGEIVGANLLYDGDWSEVHGIRFPNARIMDVQWAEPLLNENYRRYNLESIARRHLGEGKVTERLKELYGESYIQNMHKLHPGHVREYVQGDLRLPSEVLDIQLRQLESEGLLELFQLESDLYHVLLYMRQVGVRVDIDAAERFNVSLAAQQKELAKRIHNLVGFDVDIWSANSIARAFDKENIKYPKTEKGAPSFVKPWLEAHPHPLAELVSNARKLDKFKGTFIEGHILSNAIDGRIYTLFHPLKGEDGGTVTGRFSSSLPNLQNIPIRDEVLGPLVRGLFLPEEGCEWWSNDYSQIEYRLLVHYALLARCTGAEIAAERYRNDPSTDFHIFASEVTGLPRKSAKNFNFGIVYGMGEETMGAKMGKTRAEVKPILDEYHGKMPFCRQIYKLASNQASQTGAVRTILKRKRRFELWEENTFGKSKDELEALPLDKAIEKWGKGNIRRAFAHKALNAVLQGSSADMTKKAMRDGWKAGLFGPGKPLALHLTVHDELDGSKGRSKEHDEALAECKQIMIDAIPLKIPVLVASDTGANWAEAH